MTNLQKWLKERSIQNRELYSKYGKHLEKTHKGEFAAIGPNGETILGKDATAVLQEAVNKFGSGNFGLNRVGYRTFGQWLKLKK